ncbi:flagellar motor stator protein MotA [Shouchella clausii]|jgi:chemotaxis protein MotA|uniref:Flagellar motor protein MotA n=1 Tax=Shouchella clausii TaxID=79880 RepID=A0A268S1D2_SHOCL|nr:flagellar motor stator protein MotA [Shouchella clausii]PAD41782.1 flagellar motor protein MotA [Bacillus sp. 7520-S]SPU21403.1 flagellar motor protein MotA [Niallia circulans]AST97795.1 flagellar motor protein MotA [Shouchella clausii]MBU8598213.1 flagellar motor stator protein MotA [Shouchella clausii]MCM3548954.1 flagellar motor stator protein MotA [Shouchella clausii]
MDKTSFIGILLGIGTVIFGVILKGSSLEVLLNPAAIVIIIIGTIAAVLIAFPFSDIKRVPKLFGVLLSERKETSQQEIVEKFVEYATISRRDGMLALESKIEDIDDPFFQQATRMMIDGQDPDFIRHTLHERIDAMQERHATGAAIFSQAGTYSPSLGVLGAVLGLISALGNLDDINKLGESIAAAFVATLLGIFFGYVLWHPFANKLRRKSKIEVLNQHMIIEGTIAIINGSSPRAVEEYLSVYMEEKKQKAYKEGAEQRHVTQAEA